MFSSNDNKAIAQFIELHAGGDNNTFLDVEQGPSADNTDQVLQDILAAYAWTKEDLQKVEHRSIVKSIIVELKAKSGLSLRMIATVLGLSRETVRRLIVSEEPSL